ncbi:hypothetical protein QUV77_22525, partial [Xanthomonas citri pv. citri]
HNGQPIPMAGVPAHAHEAYLARLLRRGYRVALCDQMETPEQAKARKASTIRREVVRIVTPGTVTEDSLLEGGRPSWLLALAEGGGERLGAAWLDISTGMVCTIRPAGRGGDAALTAGAGGDPGPARPGRQRRAGRLRRAAAR